MQRKISVAGNKSFLNEVVKIYLLIFLLVFPIITSSFVVEKTSAGSNSYYVSTTGNDGNDGLGPGNDHAWRTVQHAMDVVTAGATVYIRAGTYYETVDPWSAASGTSSNWITFTNYTDGEAIIDVNGGLINSPGTSAIWLQSVNYYRLSSLTFRNSYTYLVLIEICHDIIVDNCTFYNCSGSALIFNTQCYNIKAENNTIHEAQTGIGYPSGYGPNEALTVLACHDFEICYNNIWNTSKLTIDVKSSSYLGSIHHNRINTTAPLVGGWMSAGPYIDAGSTYCHNISVYDNVVWGNSVGYTIGGEQGGVCTDILIYNNIYNGTQHGFQINSFPGDDLKINCAYLNNVVSGASYCFFITDINASYTNFTVRNNIFDGNVGFYLPGGLNLAYQNVDHNLYNVSSNDYYGSNSINGNPCFADPNNGDYSLLSNSPAIDNGSSINAPNFDFDGISRPKGSGFDIGAYEFISGYDTTTPQISGISIITSSPLDTDVNFGWENISCDVTDDVAVDIVYVTIVRPNDAESIVEMTNIAGSNCYYYNSSWSDYGNYSYYVWAVDSSDNAEYSESISFSLAPNWDINSDGRCSILDLILVSNHYDEIGSNGWIREDIDNNGVINLLDMSQISNYYNEGWYT